MASEISHAPLTRYRVEGLTCAHCAARIETGLRALEGFEGAAVNFAAGTISIPAGGAAAAQKLMAEIEPMARLVPPGGVRNAANDGNPRRALAGATGDGATRFLAQAGIAFVLVVVGLLTQDALRATVGRWAEYALFGVAYLVVGWHVLAGAIRTIARGRVFDELFLMTIATLGAIAINELVEAVAVMLFYNVGEYIQQRSVGRSRRSIARLMDVRPETARLIDPDGDGIRVVDPEGVRVGDAIEVRPGDRVPLDAEVVDGASTVDTAALTGESLPRRVEVGDSLLAGFVNGGGRLVARVTRPFADSSVARILELVEDAATRKAPPERFVTRFAAVYTPIVVGVAAAIAFLPPLLLPGATLEEWVYRALVALVISCPCALVISIPLGYLGGIGGAARRGVLVKGANYLDALTRLDAVVFDKTGTLTAGEFRIRDIATAPGVDAGEALRLAAAVEAHSTHPIAASIVAAAPRAPVAVPVTAVREDRGRGVRGDVEGRRVLVGTARLLEEAGIVPHDLNGSGAGTNVLVAIDGVHVATIVLDDEVKTDAPVAVSALRERGIRRIALLTGDTQAAADRVGERCGITDVRAGLLPEHKVAQLEAVQRGSRGFTAFVGDGINDAPVLMRADVGIAMGALGSDAAIEAADVVLMDDRPGGVVAAIDIARFTRRIIMQNIVLALAVKVFFLGLGAVGVATMWEAVIADMGVSVAAVLNATRVLASRR